MSTGTTDPTATDDAPGPNGSPAAGPSPQPPAPASPAPTSRRSTGAPPTTGAEVPDPPHPVLVRSSWQAAPQARRRELEREVAELARDGALDQALVDSLSADLRLVATLVGDAPRTRDRFREWLHGSRIETVWELLHGVECDLVRFRSAADLEGALPGIVSGAQRFLRRGSRCLDRAVKWLAHPPDEAVMRSGVEALLREAYDASDAYYAAVRTLRNRLLTMSATSALLTALLVVLQWRMPGVTVVPAPSDHDGPDWQLLVAVMTFGALGAFVTGLVPMLRTATGTTPYRLPFQQGLLKITVGPLAAVVGLAFLVGGLAGTQPTTLPQLLGIAAVFGASQQVVTGFADRRASELLARKEQPAVG